MLLVILSAEAVPVHHRYLFERCPEALLRISDHVLCAALKVTSEFYLYLENLNLSYLDPLEKELLEKMGV